MFKNLKYVRNRPYNSLIVRDNKLFKYSSRDRLTTEYNWYKEAAKYIPEYIPGVTPMSDFECLKLELIDGPNLFEYLENASWQSTEEIIISLSQIMNIHLHQGKYKGEMSDIKFMYYAKPLDSMKLYLRDNPELNENIRINGRKIDDH